MENQKYIEPEKSVKNKFILFFVVFIIAGYLISQYIEGRIEIIKGIQDSCEALIELKALFLYWLLIPGSAIFGIISIFFFRYGQKVLKANRYPPDTSFIIKRTKIVYGGRATFYGYLSFLTGFIALFPILCMFYVYYILGLGKCS